MPNVGIIYLTFPTKNWERDIDRAMRSFEQLDYPKDRVELICVESKGSRAPVKEWFEKNWMPKSGGSLPRIHYVFNDRELGFAANNNLGFEKAKELGCEYVHLTNEDTDVAPDYLTRAVECAQSDPKIGAVQSLILLGEERDKVNSIGNAFHFLGFGYSKGYKQQAASNKYQREEIGYASGAGVLVRVSAIDGSLFDEKFFSYHEDTDLSLRLKLRGYKVVIEPKSVIWHYYEFAKAKINYYWMERNRYALIFSYYRPWTLFLVLPALIGVDIATLILSIPGGWSDMKLKVYRDVFSSSFWKWIGERRRSIKAARKVGDRELLNLAVASIEFQEAAVQNPIVTYVGNPVLKAYWWVIRRLLV
ncbi:glycosyltransferase family 2 protein [Patescibacteria group bacterium]|nr:glycosyltransferase family 2 protein [Patescibacteria group bacterium]